MPEEEKIIIINPETGEETECEVWQFVWAIHKMSEDYIKEQGW